MAKASLLLAAVLYAGERVVFCREATSHEPSAPCPGWYGKVRRAALVLRGRQKEAGVYHRRASDGIAAAWDAGNLDRAPRPGGE